MKRLFFLRFVFYFMHCAASFYASTSPDIQVTDFKKLWIAAICSSHGRKSERRWAQKEGGRAHVQGT